MAERALAELDVAACRVVQAARTPQVAGVGPLRRFVEGGFHVLFPLVRQLGARTAEEFDAVVGKRVVAGADDDAQVRPLRPREGCHGGRGHRAQQHDIGARRVQARFQRAFEHVAGYARVFADQHRGPGLALPQHPPHGVPQAQDEVGRDGRLPHRASNAIGSKVFTGHTLQPPAPAATVFIVFVDQPGLFPSPAQRLGGSHAVCCVTLNQPL